MRGSNFIMKRDELQNTLDWAKEKLASGQEPPWAWYQYMKLRETLEAIMDGMDATTESLQQSEQHPGRHLRLVETIDQQDSVRRHPSDDPVQLPM